MKRRPLPRPQRRPNAAPGPTAPRHRRHSWAPAHPAYIHTPARRAGFSSRPHEFQRVARDAHPLGSVQGGPSLCYIRRFTIESEHTSRPTRVAGSHSSGAGHLHPSAALVPPWIRARRSSPVHCECCVGWRHAAAKRAVWRARAREGAARRVSDGRKWPAPAPRGLGGGQQHATAEQVTVELSGAQLTVTVPAQAYGVTCALRPDRDSECCNPASLSRQLEGTGKSRLRRNNRGYHTLASRQPEGNRDQGQSELKRRPWIPGPEGGGCA